MYIYIISFSTYVYRMYFNILRATFVNNNAQRSKSTLNSSVRSTAMHKVHTITRVKSKWNNISEKTRVEKKKRTPFNISDYHAELSKCRKPRRVGNRCGNFLIFDEKGDVLKYTLERWVANTTQTNKSFWWNNHQISRCHFKIYVIIFKDVLLCVIEIYTVIT